MANIHEYPVSVSWAGGREGAGTVLSERSGTTCTLGVPPEFQGTGIGTNPEELLAGSIAACYSITFGIVASMKKLPFTGVETKAVGMVEQVGASFVYKSIVLRPVITLSSDATDEQVAAAEDVAHKADGYCLITNAVRGKLEITVEPTVVRA
ncbi:MAG: OsmC family protein [Armatimonadetes bacterium]|nr:OsmC family protein [Armatimonadota bacterium]